MKALDESVFWQVVAESRSAHVFEVDGSLDRQAAALSAALERLTPDHIAGFRDCFRDRLIEAFRWDLWGVAYLLGGGCSDDGFADFRNWLVSMGREVFDRALGQPDSLADFAGDKRIEDFFFEGLQAVPLEAYQRVAGRPIPEPSRAYPASPAGVAWRDSSELQSLLPRVWAFTAQRRRNR